MNEIGRFPTKNFQFGSFDQADRIGPDALQRFFVKGMACFGCPIRCDKLYRIEEGEFKDTMLSSVEYETLSSLGSGVANGNLEAILKANDVCDRLGIDTISAGRTISFAMELYEKGIITERDTGGLQLEWGDYHLVLRLLEMISRREGIGDLLAEGTRRMAEAIGHGAEEYAMHVKGQEIPAQDGRAQQAMGLAHVTSTRGADHLKALPTVDETGYPGAAERRYGTARLPEVYDPHATKHKPYVVKDGEDFGVIIDSSGLCKLAGTLCFFDIYWEEMAEGLTLATGIDFDVATLKTIGERVYNLMRVYNVLHGITSKDDTLPKRFLEEPSPSGGAKGQVCHLPEMLPKYYQLRGWDKKTGIPKRETLKRLRLEEAIHRLHEAGIRL
jgi:aldehyde:ferredoxin oxidoreductase